MCINLNKNHIGTLRLSGPRKQLSNGIGIYGNKVSITIWKQNVSLQGLDMLVIF